MYISFSLCILELESSFLNNHGLVRTTVYEKFKIIKRKKSYQYYKNVDPIIKIIIKKLKASHKTKKNDYGNTLTVNFLLR